MVFFKIKQQTSQKENFIWNMVGSICNALVSMLLLLLINRISGTQDGGIFSLTYAVAQMMLFIGTFEVRNYQVSDVKGTFELDDYISFRIFTCFVMTLISSIYIGLFLEGIKTQIVAFLLCLTKMLEAFSDVFQGAFQRQGRIDISGKILSYRTVTSMAAFVIILVISTNLIYACAAMTIISLFNLLSCDAIFYRQGFPKSIKLGLRKSKNIFKECFPLFVSAFLTIYIINAPKYALGNYYAFDIQNIFGILFMPAFVINLFSMFIFYPMLTSLAIAWNENKNVEFITIVGKSVLWIIALTLVCLIGTYLLGIPILSIVYGVDLNGYRSALMLLMLGGGFNALSTMLRYVLTVMRVQKMMLTGYMFAFVISLIATSFLVKQYIIQGASMAYVLGMGLLSFVFGSIMIISLRKK